MADKKSDVTADDIMAPAALKPILTKSKRKPVSCAIGLTKSKDGIVLLDIRIKPKKVLANLKKKAAEAGLELDTPTLRFGRAHVDTDLDPGLVNFVVNKDSPGAMRPKLLVLLKKAGYPKLEIVVDGELEAESEEADEEEEEASPAVSGSANVAPPAAAAAAAPATPSAPTGADTGSLTKALTELIKRLQQADPARQGGLKGLAVQAQAALKSGDTGGASAAIEQLRAALDGADAADDGQPGLPDPAAKAAYVKARSAWLATRQKVEGDISKLHDGLATAFKDHGKLADLSSGFQARVEKVLNQLDEQLAHKLDAAAKATDGAEHAKLIGEAKQAMQRYQSVIASDPTLKEIDSNPFVPISIQKTLSATLSVLSKTIV